MRRERFEQLLKKLQERELSINRTKGREYAAETDVLDNFKRISRALRERGLEISPEVVCLVYLQKHIDAIFNVVARGETLSDEDLEGRVVDARLYLALLLSLFEEGNDSTEQSS